ncbi:hypothetical protein [Sediminibacillus albus]|uniref:hypothetical protein n=1 Tax=Sediminibacillus albus TaxID=407036 RepID=UPI0011142960|nr:hypothetical protein [Sediminibacillus albus]
MEKEIKLNTTFFSTIGLIICLLLLLFSAFSQGFHEFSVNSLGIHPLIITVAFSIASFFVAVLGIFKTKKGKSVIINLSVIVITLLISIIAISIFLFGNFIDNI